MVEILKLIEIPKLMFDQDLCGICDMNSTLGSVVPLAMFLEGTPFRSTELREIIGAAYSYLQNYCTTALIH